MNKNFLIIILNIFNIDLKILIYYINLVLGDCFINYHITNNYKYETLLINSFILSGNFLKLYLKLKLSSH